jgi:hypothetical protein
MKTCGVQQTPVSLMGSSQFLIPGQKYLLFPSVTDQVTTTQSSAISPWDLLFVGPHYLPKIATRLHQPYVK